MVEGRLIEAGNQLEFVFEKRPRGTVHFWSEPQVASFPFFLADIRGSVLRMPLAFDATAYRFFAEPVSSKDAKNA